MRSPMLCVAGAVLLATFSGCQKPEFAEFKSAAGKFKVLMPGKPQEKTETAAGMSLKMFALESGDGAYMAMYADMPVGNESKEMSAQRLDGARDGAIRNSGATLISSKDIKLANKYPGRDVLAAVPKLNGKMHMRLFIVDKRLYQIMAIGKSNWLDSADTAKFLDSFALTD